MLKQNYTVLKEWYLSIDRAGRNWQNWQRFWALWILDMVEKFPRQLFVPFFCSLFSSRLFLWGAINPGTRGSIIILCVREKNGTFMIRVQSTQPEAVASASDSYITACICLVKCDFIQQMTPENIITSSSVALSIVRHVVSKWAAAVTMCQYMLCYCVNYQYVKRSLW